MPGSREIRNKIRSIKNTQKITKAMEMVAAAKMRKAQERTRASRPYAFRVLDIVTHLAGTCAHRIPAPVPQPISPGAARRRNRGQH